MWKIITLSLIVIVIVWGGYYLNFGLEGHISKQTDVWGQFGDYVGGVLNPILSFISIYLLINSLSLQREANTSLVKEVNRQESLEGYKKFEMRFFHLVESLEKTFSRFGICVGDVDGEEDGITEKYTAGSAVTYIEDSLVVLVDEGINKERIKEWLTELDSDDCLFSIVRRFYLIIKLINESGYEKDEHYEILINLTDLKIITLVAVACSYFDWEIVDYINSSKVLNRSGINDFVNRVNVS
ncbi:hypothetical protein I6G46_00250 [Serratia plymuthica]|uniref:hypothetical protein n=1 Tax=Serratia plymuthica TaxID=82996 RepID=UPI0018D5AD7D|nr:hypothetical protein [Serratia plymuthica]QPS87450.1 hypothetical protein I6G46_00250 [Serratia plymuthica]